MLTRSMQVLVTFAGAATLASGVSCSGAIASVGASDGGSESSNGSASGSSSGSSGGSGGSASGSSSGSSGGSSGSGSASGSSSGSSGASGGSGSSSGGSSSGGAGDCAGAAPIPASASRSASLVLTGVNFGGPSVTDWENIGLDLDGKCTTAKSTDVCALAAGAVQATQADGTGGIDNSWGENICPILETVSGSGACTGGVLFVTTDANGIGQLAVTWAGQLWQFPIQDAYVVTNGSAGTLAAVAPTAGVISALQLVAGSISVGLCDGYAFAAIAQQMEQAADILANGTNVPGQSCSAISIGVTFTGSSALGTFPAPPVDVCGD